MRIIKESSQVLIEEKPEYVDHNGVQSRLYKLSKTDKKTGEKKTRYFVKDKDYEPLTVPDNDLNADLPNRANFVAYKQFKTLYNTKDPNTEQYKGKLYPLFVGAKQKDGIEIGKWYKCGTGELRIEVDKTGKPVPGGAIQVDSKLGNLAYRPGWHMGSAPVTRHIGVGASRAKDDHNDYDAMYSENVWAKVEYSGHYDYTDKAKTMPGADKDPKKAMFTDKKDIANGFYHYKTNSNADDSEDWLIADAIKVLSVLKDETVKSIANEHGLKAQNRWEADGSDGNKFYADFSQFEVVESMNKEIKEALAQNCSNKFLSEFMGGNTHYAHRGDLKTESVDDGAYANVSADYTDKSGNSISIDGNNSTIVFSSITVEDVPYGSLHDYDYYEEPYYDTTDVELTDYEYEVPTEDIITYIYENLADEDMDTLGDATEYEIEKFIIDNISDCLNKIGDSLIESYEEDAIERAYDEAYEQANTYDGPEDYDEKMNKYSKNNKNTKKSLSESFTDREAQSSMYGASHPELFPDYDDDYDFGYSEMEVVEKKQVYDSDGFLTDYTWYISKETGNNVFVFGDSDLYAPEDGNFDYETDNYRTAQEWFDNYSGFANEAEIDESIGTINKRKDKETKIMKYI